ncbi:MAG: hypothetical protein J6J13_00005 [Clostridia bacterium]|nr:hypothetical protein [Clostridia bacterium]
MMKYERDLDVIALRLKNVSDLLKCFLNFCDIDQEGKTFSNTKDFAGFAAGFLEELKIQKALVESALFTVDYEYGILQSLYDEWENKRR